MLTWNVYVGDCNKNRIDTYNIFKHGGFYRACRDEFLYLGELDKKQAEQSIRGSLRYYFWSKCEWEIVLSGWPEFYGFQKEQIDVAAQVELNWDRFFEYLWTHRHELTEESHDDA